MSYRFRAVAAGAAAAAAVLVLAPPAGGAPAQQCDQTVGNSVDSYLTRHPDVKRDLNKRAQAESPGSPNALLDYLNKHPDVRQALITLSQQCTS